MIYLGITGTQSPGVHVDSIIRRYLTPYSRDVIVVQGCCIGVDARAALIAHDMGFQVNGVVPSNRAKVSDAALAVCERCIYMPPGTSYMERNDELVRMIDKLAGFPKTNVEELRSGTWATIRRGWKRLGRDNVDIVPVGGI